MMQEEVESDNDESIRATLNYDCNYNLFLAKRLIRDVKKCQDRRHAVEWLRCLTESKGTVADMRLRNDFLRRLVKNLQEGSLRTPFNGPPPAIIAAAAAHSVAHERDNRRSAATIDDVTATCDDVERPVAMEKSPDGGAFLALQPIPREGSFCYLAITTRKKTN